MKNYQDLSNRNIELLLTGAKTTGNFTDGYCYIEESLYISEADELLKFCEWIDENIGGAGINNINKLWLHFKYPENNTFKVIAEEIKEMIQRIKAY